MSDMAIVTALLERLGSLLDISGEVIVLERLARGAGATRWFYCRTLPEIELVLPQLRPGSRVGFFFDHRIHRRPFSEEVEAELWDIATASGEVLVGTQRSLGLEVDMTLLDTSDLSEHLVTVHAGEVIFYGVFPSTDADGDSAITFTPPDADGVVRAQPV